jgi:hypothetical protein
MAKKSASNAKTTKKTIKATTATKSKKSTKAKSAEETKETSTGKYLYFKNPKYFNYARKLSKLDADEIGKAVEEYKFTLQEKIHVGNLVSNLSSKVCQHGEYKEGVKTVYPDPKKYDEFYKTCLGYTRKELQRILELNQCPKSAGKEVLAERVADGLLLGGIPKCPSCGGGRLRFNNQTGKYICPGFIDGGYFYSDLGDDYIFCNKIYDFKDIERIEFLK